MRRSLFKNVVLLPIICWASPVLPAFYLQRSLTQCAGDLGHISRFPCVCKNCHPEGSALWMRNSEPFLKIQTWSTYHLHTNFRWSSMSTTVIFKPGCFSNHSESSLKIQTPQAYLRLSESKHTGMGCLEDSPVTLMQTNGGPRTESFNSISPWNKGNRIHGNERSLNVSLQKTLCRRLQSLHSLRPEKCASSM